MDKMDNKSKILLTVLVVLILVSLFLTYYRSFISRDYEIIQSEEKQGSAETPQEVSPN